MPQLMTGFPTAPQAQVTLANWQDPPFNRWAFRHMRELIPSQAIAADPAGFTGPAPPRPLRCSTTRSPAWPDPQNAAYLVDTLRACAALAADLTNAGR